MTRYQPLLYQAGSYNAAELRHLIAATYPVQGVSGMAASVVAGTMNLQIGQGRAVVSVGGVTGMLDNVLCVSDANEVVPIAAAPPSGQSRIDIVSVAPNEAALGWTFYVAQGTPAASPVAPSPGGGVLPVWQVLVPGGVANLNTATLTDLRLPLVPGGPKYSARMSRNAAQPLATGWSPVQFDSKTYDPYGCCTLGTTAHYTCPVAGLYRIDAGFVISPVAASLAAIIYRNATAVTQQQGSLNASSAYNGVPIGDLIQCNAGDTLSIQVSPSAAATLFAGTGLTNFMTVALDSPLP